VISHEQKESQVGFYSPSEPRHISISDLFDDNKTWSSQDSANQNNPSSRSSNRNPSVQHSTNRKSSLESHAGCSDESFVSDSTMQGTSSVSLPPVSHLTGASSPMKLDGSLRNSPVRSFQTTPRRSSNSNKSNSGSSKSFKSPPNSTVSARSSVSYSRISQRASPDLPKQSSHLPTKSNSKRRTSQEKNNVLKINIPTAAETSETGYTTSFGDIEY